MREKKHCEISNDPEIFASLNLLRRIYGRFHTFVALDIASLFFPEEFFSRFKVVSSLLFFFAWYYKKVRIYPPGVTSVLVVLDGFFLFFFTR